VLAPTGLTTVALFADDTAGVGVATVALAGVLALVGMWLSETAFVRAGQSVPLS